MSNPKRKLPSKEELIDKLMDIADGYDGTIETPVKPSDAIRAIAEVSKMMGFNAPSESKVEVTEIAFEIG